VVGAVRRPPTAGTGGGPLLVEHLGSLGVLVIVDGEGLATVDPATLDATAVERSLDPLTPMWRVAGLPAGDRIGGREEAQRWRRDTQVLGGALLVGLASATVDMAVAYAKDREQFGRPIGSFQAVKHLCADMLVRVEVARAAVHAAAVNVDQPDVGDGVRAAAGAALLAAEAAVANGKSCIQVHGGMGFTWEVPAHLYLMRARVLSRSVADGGLAELVAERF
jgi:alkylation response protein AidB-like acyl-CoA dehydrogenase